MAQAWYHLGVALWLTQHPDPAVRALQKAVALAPDHGDYHYRLGAAYAQTRAIGKPFRSWYGQASNYPLTPRSGRRWATPTNN
jgi:Flp pilus assembly protein TadD